MTGQPLWFGLKPNSSYELPDGGVRGEICIQIVSADAAAAKPAPLTSGKISEIKDRVSQSN